MKCPETKEMMEELVTMNDTNLIRGKMIDSIRSLNCGSPTNQTVCCKEGIDYIFIFCPYTARKAKIPPKNYDDYIETVFL